MGGSFKIGRAFGIEVKVHWTFFLLLAFFGFTGYQNSGSLPSALVTVGIIVALFVCVLLHEFGHALMAQRVGIETADITLLPIGGLARLKSLPDRPWDEVKIAIAGPLVNVVLAPIFFGIALLLGGQPHDAAQHTRRGAVRGAGLRLPRLHQRRPRTLQPDPRLPDGRRARLRGLLATRYGLVRATDIASAVGQFFAAAFFLLGLLSGNLLLALIAVFIFFGATGEAQMVRQREQMRGLLVSDVMGTRPRLETVTPYHTFGQVLDSVIHGYQEDFPVVDENGKLVGMLTRNEIMTAAHSPERYASVRDLMKTDFPTISPDADLFTDGARILQESDLKALPVVRDGELVGMLTMEDIGESALLRDIRKLQY